MRLLLVSAAAAALLSACATNPPEPAAPAVDVNSPLYAPNYLGMAGSSDQFEIQSGQLAQQMSQNPSVRQIGQMLVADHTNSTQQLMAAAQSAGIAAPPRHCAQNTRRCFSRYSRLLRGSSTWSSATCRSKRTSRRSSSTRAMRAAATCQRCERPQATSSRSFRTI
ncbi:DUF4142 domain-containing protein [Sphingomonas daechungensis]|uniref:DUF4142 domain-containing protein n=1 Tax=Sphingomonas daechungensis TaxID=1176646 RepID=A0ABX6SZ86_9SPHN|nr:DUF4142 domain-containing protein [Sphingomonas daechungensis]